MCKIKAYNGYRETVIDSRDIMMVTNDSSHKLMFTTKNNVEYTITGCVNKFLKTRAGKKLVWINKGVAFNPECIDTSKPFDVSTIYLKDYEKKIKVAEKLVRQLKKRVKTMKKPNWRRLFFRKGRRVRGVMSYEL